MPTDVHDALPDQPRRSGAMPVPEDRPSGAVPVGREHEEDSGIGPATDVMYTESDRRHERRRQVDRERAAVGIGGPKSDWYTTMPGGMKMFLQFGFAGLVGFLFYLQTERAAENADRQWMQIAEMVKTGDDRAKEERALFREELRELRSEQKAQREELRAAVNAMTTTQADMRVATSALTRAVEAVQSGTRTLEKATEAMPKKSDGPGSSAWEVAPEPRAKRG